jgi:hypothetical protein
MKIGIITYWTSQDNYGQLLQCYALQTFLKNLGHEVFLIKDVPVKIRLTEKAVNFLQHFSTKGILRFFFHRWQMCRLWYSDRINKHHPRNFERFRSSYIASTEKVYSIDELRSNPPAADAYICGSDQIWNTASPIYFLDFGDNAKRISYATSFGSVSNKDDNYFKQISVWLKHFDVVTVREHRGVGICGKLGREEVLCVPDPTLLLSKSEYMQIIQPFETHSKAYIFLYLLSNSTTVDIKSIYAFAQKEGLEVVYVTSQGRFDKYPKDYPTIGQWIFLINNAKYIMTNSYHGVIFSMLMNKSFLALPLKGEYSEMNDRLDTLFNDYQIPLSLYSSNINAIKNEIIYDEINLKLIEKREWIKNKMKIWL